MAWIRKGEAALVLAPMEGVTDSPMRALLSELGGFTHTVTEFLRINDLVPPVHVYHRHMVELHSYSKTAAGKPVILQLLGGNAERLAESALRGAKLGAAGIDLNFGCPAPTVNKHDGGATLLQYPERIFAIVKAVRAAVPEEIPVSVKMRLGWDNMDALYRNAEMATLAGANWIAVHGRTKFQGYKPPAYWEPIGNIAKELPIPVIANGEIWTIDDFERCRDATGCEHYMLGRGALANPHLGLQVAHALGIGESTVLGSANLEEWHRLLSRFILLATPLSDNSQYVLRRIKQWLRYADSRQNFMGFDTVKRLETIEAFENYLHSAAFGQTIQ